MAIKKISEFTEITALEDNDLFLIERNGEAKYIKASAMKTYFGDGGGGGGDEPTGGDYITENEVHFTSDSFVDASGGDGSVMKCMHMEGICDWLADKMARPSENNYFKGLTGVFKSENIEIQIRMTYSYYLNEAGQLGQLIFLTGQNEGALFIIFYDISQTSLEVTSVDDNIVANMLPEGVTDFEVTLNWNPDSFSFTGQELTEDESDSYNLNAHVPGLFNWFSGKTTDTIVEGDVLHPTAKGNITGQMMNMNIGDFSNYALTSTWAFEEGDSLLGYIFTYAMHDSAAAYIQVTVTSSDDVVVTCYDVDRSVAKGMLYTLTTTD